MKIWLLRIRFTLQSQPDAPAMTDSMRAESDAERGHVIPKHLMKANLSAKSSSQDANIESQHKDESDHDSEEEFDPASLNFESFQNIGPFKSQVEVYMLSPTTDSVTTSLRCTVFAKAPCCGMGSFVRRCPGRLPLLARSP